MIIVRKAQPEPSTDPFATIGSPVRMKDAESLHGYMGWKLDKVGIKWFISIHNSGNTVKVVYWKRIGGRTVRIEVNTTKNMLAIFVSGFKKARSETRSTVTTGEDWTAAVSSVMDAIDAPHALGEWQALLRGEDYDHRI